MSSLQAKVISLIGALFCFFAALLLLFGFNALTFNDLSFYSQSRPVVEALQILGSSLLIAFGLFFLRDYFRS